MIKDGSCEDPNSINQLYNFSDKDFREEMMRMFKELKATVELTANKTHNTGNFLLYSYHEYLISLLLNG